jgi:hypothetical protein
MLGMTDAEIKAAMLKAQAEADSGKPDAAGR